MNPPPPPPPHGNNAGNKNGLPDGNYDIFIIPPHSAGSGFLYLPSLQPQWNSFAAGVVTTLLVVVVSYIVVPVLKEWFQTMVAGGASSVIILLIFASASAWALGKTTAGSGGPAPGQGHTGAPPRTHTAEETAGGPPPQPQSQPQPQYAPPPDPRPPPPKPTWQRANPGPANGTANPGATKSGWEKAREETRKKEEERKKAEELKKKREDAEKERVMQREKDAREREARERRERFEKERAERAEKAEKAEKAARPASPTRNHHHPTAKTATDDDAYSYRPYDNPKRPSHKTASATASSIYSESSYAPSQSTNRTTPPPSHRGAYRSKDPDKIVLKAVYSFNNTFIKVPIAKLVSGMKTVTDGLILRITTEGLFIDDDVRGVPQREWDVKAWTLKLVEVWCPHLHGLGASSGSTPASRNGVSGLFGKKWASTAPTNEETDAFLDASTRACKPYCLSGNSINRSNQSGSSQSGEFKGLHVLRASIRDQEGKRYVFVLQEEEGWKVAVGLQRLRRGTQVRALGVSGMAANETKAILENTGWV